MRCSEFNLNVSGINAISGTTDEEEKKEQIKVLKLMLNRLNAARKVCL